MAMRRFLSLPLRLIPPTRRISSIGANGEPQQTVEQVVQKLRSMLEVEPWHMSSKRGCDHLKELLPDTQDELPARRMSDSWDQAWIPIGRDTVLRDKYLSFTGSVRVGRLLEDMDIFAGWICYKHILNPKQEDGRHAHAVVTALVDQIEFTEDKLKADQDLKLTGHVSWSGKSSIEITIALSQIDESNKWKPVTEAVFVMVARNPATKGSAIVNALEPEGDHEVKIFKKGEANKTRRLTWEKQNIFIRPPTDEERVLIHKLFASMRDPDSGSFVPSTKPDDCCWMSDAKLKNIIICHPEERNVHHKIFGGFLMRQAMELAFANSFVYSKQRPRVLHIDDIWFRRPVEVGSLLYFASQVVYVSGQEFLVRVTADVVDPTTGKHELTNTFHFTFKVENPIPEVMPRTYHESLLYLDGRRRFLHFRKNRGLHHPTSLGV